MMLPKRGDGEGRLQRLPRHRQEDGRARVQGVAKKYKGDAAASRHSARRCARAAAGIWGQIPMPPNPPEKISDADLKVLVEWVLTKY